MALAELALDGHVATVTLNRPEVLNAISGAMADQVAGAVLQAAANKTQPRETLREEAGA